MRYTAAHWGAYAFDADRGLHPFADDPAPSRIGRGWLSAATNEKCRILAPVIRKGWLEGDRGAGRSSDDFVRVSWEEAVRQVAEELKRVRTEHGNGAIFGGSYGWASAGRFHHAQSQLRRFLNCFGGYVGSRETYSHAAAEVLFPYILGMSQRQLQDSVTSIEEVAARCELLLAFGGISGRTAQIASSGSSYHEIPNWLDRLSAGDARLVSVSPQRSDLPGAEWVSIRPGTDTALMLALTYEIVAAGRENRAFLDRCTSGWLRYRAYLLGKTDSVAKSADWAAPICDVATEKIRSLAYELSVKRSMIAVAWGLQRADHGEQPIWAALALASVLGQIGQPGTGFSFGYGSTTPVGRPTRLIPWPSLPQGRNPVEEFIPVARIADMLIHAGEHYRYKGETRTYPEVRLVYWVGGNPFHHHQDLNRLNEAWKRPDTVIIHDHTWTASARRADIVLPATTPLERADIMMNHRDPCLIYMSQILPPMGKQKTTTKYSAESHDTWTSKINSRRAWRLTTGYASSGSVPGRLLQGMDSDSRNSSGSRTRACLPFPVLKIIVACCVTSLRTREVCLSKRKVEGLRSSMKRLPDTGWLIVRDIQHGCRPSNRCWIRRVALCT